MNNISKRVSGKKVTLSGCRAVLALMATTLVAGGSLPPVVAFPQPVQISQNQQDWNGALRLGRLVNNRQQVTALVMQLDVLNKPETSYANAVYQVYGRINGQWELLYTNTGARLISNSRGRVTLPPEVIQLSDLEDDLDGINLNNVELKGVVQLRYDVQGRRNQVVQWEQVQTYSAIALTSTTQIATTPTNPSPRPGSGSNQTASTQFSLAIRQAQVTLPEVIARVSLKSRQNNQFQAEKFVGDFRYRMNQRAEFIRGLNVGDRVVVRLFSLDNRLVGYSEFELLSTNSAVTLVLPSQTSSYGVVRTVYGVDSDRNGSIDSNSSVYDYFTQISGNSLSASRVTFLRTTQSLNLRLFQVQGLPTPPSTCAYTNAFTSGSYALVSQTISVFSRNLIAPITALPGQLVQLITLNTSRVSVYEVTQLLTRYEEYNGDTVVIIDDGDCDGGCNQNDDDDDWEEDDDDDHGGRRHCNQGIGNGSEGCDPGNSRPHGGSNDEGGRRPGGRNRNR